MVAKEMNDKATNKEKFFGLIFCYILFLIIYNFTGWYASNHSEAGSFVFGFEYDIPFLSWMIIPYLSSGLLFAVVFFLCSYRKDLRLLIKRISFITIASGLFFILFPLRFSFARPDVEFPVLNFFYEFLNTWDTNYNQAPSLHISYACMFWLVFCRELGGIWKIIAGIWLLMMGVSTLTIYQHHLIDIIAALFLVCATVVIFPDTKTKSNTNTN